MPDVQVSLDVELPADLWEKTNRSYMAWVYGKPPDIVVELVCNRKGGETDRKFKTYAEQGVGYYLVFDPQCVYGARKLRIYQLRGRTYVEIIDPGWLPDALLGVKLWKGSYEGYQAVWMRWCDAEAKLPAAASRASRAGRAQSRGGKAQSWGGRAARQRRGGGGQPPAGASSPTGPGVDGRRRSGSS